MSEITLWQNLPQFHELNEGLLDSKREKPSRNVESSDEIIREAHRIADQIVRDAKTEATILHETATSEYDNMLEQARQAGYAQGIEQARIDASQEMASEWNERIAALQSDVQAVLTEIVAQRTAMWKASEAEIVAFALEMAKKVIKTEVQENPKVIGEMIKHALRRVVNKDHVRIRINPADIDAVRSQREDLALVLDGASNLDIVDDRRVERGGCLVETPAGNIDAKIDTQVERIALALEVE